MIYFLRCDQDHYPYVAGWIKIGTTIRLSERLKQVAVDIGHIPTVLAVIQGAYAEEQALHRKFNFFRKLHEWFEPNEDLLRLIKEEGQAWDGTDESPLCRKPMVAQLRGSAEWKAWIEKLAKFDNRAVTSLFDRAVHRYAKEIGFPDEPPER